MDQLELLRRTLDILEASGITYMLVGSFASSAWGEPRLTQDIDIVVDLHPNQVAAFCAAFPPPDFYVSRDAAEQAARAGIPFNVLHPATGNKVDVIPARRDAWGMVQIARRRRVWLLPDRQGYCAAPEDLILGKLWYYQEGGSEKHLRDIVGILRVSGDAVNQEDITRWAKQLGLVDEWQAVLSRLNQEP